MTGNPVATSQDLDGALGDAQFHLFAHQGVRHTVVMTLELDEVIDIEKVDVYDTLSFVVLIARLKSSFDAFVSAIIGSIGQNTPSTIRVTRPARSLGLLQNAKKRWKSFIRGASDKQIGQ